MKKNFDIERKRESDEIGIFFNVYNTLEYKKWKSKHESITW